MHNEGALLRLQDFVSTIGHEAFNDMIEGVVIVIVQDDVPAIRNGILEADRFFDEGLLFNGVELEALHHAAIYAMEDILPSSQVLPNAPNFNVWTSISTNWNKPNQEVFSF